ncbi:hypothetical protein CKA32_002848 [Geitlerinema sp. FC II]|nr:endolytic transglycosylase MltG [Geitlerinema sp. CS-897]PPT10450.1 hypothetical protein CKA32_002848 [Geitlerinema sp. FC II]
MKRIWTGAFYLAIPAALAVGGWQGWSWWSWANAPVTSEEDAAPVQLEIPTGTPAGQIGRDLEELGIVRSASAWNLRARWLRWQEPSGGFQAGVYRLSPGEPMTDIADRIWNGQVVEESFTIPEGWSRQNMAAYFEEREFFSARAFLEATTEIPRDRFPWLPADLPHLEGFLFPDTYQLSSRGTTPEAVVTQMLSQFEAVALPLYEAADNPPLALTLREWVTLSSIVEREAVVPEERRTIAGVFVERLDRGMKLEADPTVEYALGIQQTVDRPLTLTQVAVDSPYNTYLNSGLPPTPIASPGQASLAATLDPEETEYLYFVARYDGTHLFSRTLAEHEAAIDRVERELSTQ